MLYKPTFCCECGDKIERIRWRLWTSRRFCENCETDYLRQEWLPKILMFAAVAASGLIAFGSYLKTPEKPLSLTAGQVARRASDQPANGNERQTSKATVLPSPPASAAEETIPNRNAAAPLALKAADLINETADEPLYFCGAQTKKRTPCGRKVKGGGRCWQHTGQPSLLPKNKLAAQR